MTDLLIFGYGSLIWKNSELPFTEAYPSFITGYKRRFWQLSEDHRGVPGAPGRVVTLYPDSDSEEDAIVHGITFRIAAEQVEKTLSTLDIREQGGYQRVKMPVFAHRVPGAVDDAKQDGEQIGDALVYWGSPDNEMFNIPPPGDSKRDPAEAPEELAQQIARSHGPSGDNASYLLNLATSLRELLHAPDAHVFALEKRVKEILLAEEQKKMRQQDGEKFE